MTPEPPTPPSQPPQAGGSPDPAGPPDRSAGPPPVALPPQWPQPSAPPSGHLAAVGAVVVGAWSVAAVVLSQLIGWLVTQALLLSGWKTLGLMWPIVALIGAGLIAPVAVLVAFLPRSAPVRATGRAWLLATPALAVLGSLRAIPSAYHDVYLAVLAVGAALLAVLYRHGGWTGVNRSGGGWFRTTTLAAAAVGCAVLAPFAWLGALGSASEALLAAAAAVAVGWLASTLLTDRWWAGVATGPLRLTLGGGLAAGVLLTVLAGGVGGSGTQLAMLVVLPPLGFAAAALRESRAVLLLVALAAFGPLAFLDDEETVLPLNLGTREVGYWALVAVALGFGIALLAAVACGLAFVARGRLATGRQPQRWLVSPVAVATVLALIGGYAVIGQPGLHGDRLFVVLRDQANLTGLATIANREVRLRTTYRRLVEHAERTQAPLRRALSRARLRYTPYYLVNGIEVHSASSAVRAWLARRDDVDRVLVSPRLRPLPKPAPTARGTLLAPTQPMWNITSIKADQVWRAGVTGRGIVVGSVDSGVDGTHPALRGGFRGGDDSWYDPWNGARFPTDHNGHGTHTLGSAVGRAPNSVVPGPQSDDASTYPPPAIGVAPGAQWIGCVNLHRNFGNPARYLDCLQFMLAPFPYRGDPFRDGRPERAAHILTNSWSCPTFEGCDQQALRQATAALTAAGIFLVAAAGNYGPICESIVDPPAIYPDVVAVAAVGPNGELADFSSRGPGPGGIPKPDIAAPGKDVLSALPGNSYGMLSGTSMATPHVAGVVALMWSANPALIGDIERTRQILVSRTTLPPEADPDADGDIDVDGGCGPTAGYGAGVVDAQKAVLAATPN